MSKIIEACQLFFAVLVVLAIIPAMVVATLNSGARDLQ